MSTSSPEPGNMPSSSPASPPPCPPQVSRSLWHRFYEPLILLSAYGKSQGDHFKLEEEDTIHGSSKSPKKRFLDQLAYICDIELGGDSVTAIAIQEGPPLTYWLAANEAPKAKSIGHLTEVLRQLETAYPGSPEKTLKLRDEISKSSMRLAHKKLEFWSSKLRNSIKPCLKSLNTKDQEATDLKQWIETLNGLTSLPHSAELSTEMSTLCQFCYEARKSPMLELIERRATSSMHQHNNSCANKFANIRHLIGRLGSFIKAARILVDTGYQFPQLFTDYSIKVATCHRNFTPPEYRSKSSIKLIINRMVREPEKCEWYQDMIASQDQKFGLDLQNRIKEEYEDSKSKKLRVHAEIVLLDLFHRRQKELRFPSDLRYIGVSKPSCFLCWKYIQAHPLRVQTSGTSNNLYIQWQPPYIQDSNPKSVRAQEDILNTIINDVRTFVLDKIVPDYQGFKSHPDSTTGLDSLTHVDTASEPTKKRPKLSPSVRADGSGVSKESDCKDVISAPSEDFEEGGVSSLDSIGESDVQWVNIFLLSA